MKNFGVSWVFILGLLLTLSACGGGSGQTDSEDSDPNVSIIAVDPDGDGLTNNEDSDDDNDGNPDVSDSDDDGDSVADEDDLDSRDTDGDGTPDAQDADDDGDGVNDSEDTDDDNDGIADSADPSTLDSDGDGTVDEADTDDDGDGIPDASDPDLIDSDGDGTVDASDPDLIDSDGDGTVDASDPDLIDSDSDGDGTVDTSDPDLIDSDGDGTVDASDAFPIDATETTDTDGDGYGNNADCNDSNSAINPGAVELCDNTATDENCDELTTAGSLFAGDLTIDSTNETNIMATFLGGYCGIDGSLTIDSTTTLTHVNDFSGITTITGNLLLKGHSIADLSGFDNLVSVRSIKINPNPALTSLTGFNNLTALPSGLTVANASYITDISGFQALKSVYSINLYNNDAMADISGFNLLTTLEASLQIKDNDSLNLITGLGTLAAVGGDLTITDNPLLSPCTVTTFLSHVTVTGTTTTTGNGTDTDGDCTIDSLDAFPGDSTETADADGDGTGDNADTDDDNDGVGDTDDAFPNNATESKDTDSDGVGDNTDDLPNDPAETVDADGDLSGANSDCNDADSAVYPGATETPDDGIDQDCDGEDASLTLDITDINTGNTNLIWVNVTTGLDTNDCATTTTPCQTIQAAIGKATANTDGILVMEGTYNEDITVSGTAVKIYGGVYEDTATSPSVWKSAPFDHRSRLTYGDGLKNLTFSSSDGVNVFYGFGITASPKAQAIVIDNASVTISKVAVSSKANTAVSDTDMASLVGATYSTTGDFTFTLKDSILTLGKLTGGAATTKIQSELLNIAVTDSGATPVIKVTGNTFRGGDIVESATVTSSWVRGIYYHDDYVGATTPVPLTFSGNTLNIGAPTDSGGGLVGTIASGIVIGGNVTATLEDNQITHLGAYADYAVYLNVPAENGGSVTLRDNLIRMAAGIGANFGVMVEQSGSLTLLNNTIAHESGVDDAYAVMVSADPGQALTFMNNIFYSVSSDNTRYFSFDFTPSATITCHYNLFYNSNGSPLLTINGTQYTVESDITALSNVSWENNVTGTDPGFDSAYTPSAAAPAVDAGYLPSGADTSDWTDVYGNPRVADGDGDGAAEIDMGAVENMGP